MEDYTIYKNFTPSKCLQIVCPGMWQLVVGRGVAGWCGSSWRGAGAGCAGDSTLSVAIGTNVISRAPRWRSCAYVTLITICAVTLPRAESQGCRYLYSQIGDRPRPRRLAAAPSDDLRHPDLPVATLSTIICGSWRPPGCLLTLNYWHLC